MTTWNALFLQGSVVDLDTRVWTARTGLRAKDLGVADTPDVERALTLGQTRLAPREAFNDLRDICLRAKRAMEAKSLTFPYVRGARYVPAAQMPALLAALRAHRDEFDAAADAFVAAYDETTAAMLPIIQRALIQAARTEEAAVEAYNRILDEYPTSDALRRKFSMTWSIYSISAPRTIAAAEAAQEEADATRSVVAAMVAQVRDEFKERVGVIAAIVARGGKIPVNTVASTEEVIARVEAMNILGDRALTEQVAKLRSIILAASGGGAQGALADIVGIQTALETSAAQAVADAEASLTAVGVRQFNLAQEAK